MDAKILTPNLKSVKKESQQVDSEITTPDNTVPHLWDLKTLKSMENSYHKKALNFKANCTVGLGYTLTNKNGEPPKELPGFMGMANPLESFEEVTTPVALDYDETGQGYWEVVRNLKGEPSELYWIPSETVFISKDKKFFLQKVNEKTRKFLPFNPDSFSRPNPEIGEIIRIKFPSNRSPFYGQPDWIGAVAPMLLDSFAVEWNYRFFQNNAIPAFAIIIEGGKMSPPVEKAVKDFLTNNYKGVSNAHSTLYLPIENKDVKVRLEEVTKKPAEGEFQKMRDQIRDEILSAHGVPPRIMGVVTPGSLGGSGEAAQQLKIFKEVLIAPRQRQFEQTLNRTILKPYGLNLQFTAIDTTPEKDDVDTVTKLVQTGTILPEEGRILLSNFMDIPDLAAIKAEDSKKPKEVLAKEATTLLYQFITLRKQLQNHLAA